MPELTQAVVDKAAAINTTLDRESDAVRSNGDYSQDARDRYLAKSYIKALDAMAALQQSFEGTNADQAATLRRDLFGAASARDAISVRDADDRASRLESASEALNLLNRAEENGDDVLSRAIAQTAYAKSQDFFEGTEWATVMAAYSNAHPDVAAKLERLNAATRQEKLSAASMFAFLVPRPPELGSYPDYQIRGMAA